MLAQQSALTDAPGNAVDACRSAEMGFSDVGGFIQESPRDMKCQIHRRTFALDGTPDLSIFCLLFLMMFPEKVQ